MERTAATGDPTTVALPSNGTGRPADPIGAGAPRPAEAGAPASDAASPGVASPDWLAGELRWARLSETLVVLFGGIVLLAAHTWPAFGAFFFGEDFVYLGRYREVGNDLIRGTLNPIHGWFFRPLSNLVEWISYNVLPLDPWIYHLRNFAFIVLNILLLHQLLKHLVASRAVRLLVVVYYAVSKVHLTVIGYLSVFDSAVNVALLLATLLFFIRYIDRRRPIDYALGTLFASLAIFIKDYGLVIVAVVVTLVAVRGSRRETWRRDVRFWLPRLAPLGIVLVIALALRVAVVTPLPAGDPAAVAYAPRLSVQEISYRLLVLTSTMANLSYGPRHITGTSGVGGWLERSFPALALRADRVDVVLYVAFMALVAYTLWAGRRAGWMLLVPMMCIAAYYGPSTLTRNLQMYYMNESLAASAILLGLCLAHAGRRLVGVWVVAVALIGANAWTSSSARPYTWQYAAGESEKVMTKLIAAHRGQPLESLTFATDRAPVWGWVLTFDGTGTMVSELLQHPGIDVRVVGYSEARARLGAANATNPFYDLDRGVVPIDRDRPPAEPVLTALLPPRTAPGVGINVQPDGRSALALRTEYATESTVVVMGDTPLTTVYRDPSVLTAIVPAELLASEGRIEVFLRNGAGDSNRLEFVVDGRAPIPAVRSVFPSSARAGEGVNVQPNGRSAIAVSGENAQPETVVVMDGRPLETTYNNASLLTAFVPDDLVATPGRRAVYLRTGAEESNRIDFVVEP